MSHRLKISLFRYVLRVSPSVSAKRFSNRGCVVEKLPLSVREGRM